jgi:hypothetical protein
MSQQSFTDRDAVWQEELQQQQAESNQLQAVPPVAAHA